VPEDIALFIDFENIRYSMLNIQRREPDPQELIAVARRYGTVMVARAYADWSRQPEPFKGSLTAAMIDRVDCPAKQRDRIRMGTFHYTSGNTPTGALSSSGYIAEQGVGSSAPRQWPGQLTGNSGPLPAITSQTLNNGWGSETETPSSALDNGFPLDPPEENYNTPDYQQRESYRSSSYQNSYGQSPAGVSGQGGTGPLGYSTSTGNTGHMPAINANGNGNGIVQSTVVQSTVDLNMLMDIIETVFDRPTISTFVLMTGDKDFTRISARLKLRLNKNVIVVGIPGTVSRDLISSANQFVPLVPNGFPTNGASLSGNTGTLPSITAANFPVSTGSTAPMQAITLGNNDMNQQLQQGQYGSPSMDVLDPQFLQFLDYIDRNWSWRTIIGVSNFIGDPLNPKNRFRGRLTRESARELLNTCVQQGILLVQTDQTGAEDLRLNRMHPGVDDVLKQFVR
jgi:uncharacterized LabA/DUF88 family protein